MSDSRPADAAIAHLKRTYTPGAGRPSEDLESSEPPLELDVDLIWPPPGLEQLHGLMTRVTGRLLLAAFVLLAAIALPALLDQPPENGSWGTVVAFIIAGVLLWSAYMWLLVMFNRMTTGVRSSYPRPLVWQVAADAPGNTFEILAGRGAYERLSTQQRRELLRARVLTGVFGLAGALWLTTSLPVLLGLGAAGWLGARGFWLLTLLPALICLAAAAYFRIRDVRLDYGNRIPDEEAQHQRQQARAWRHFFQHIDVPVRDAANVAGYRVGAAAAFLAVFMMLVPIAIAVFTTFVPFIVRTDPMLYSHSVRMSALAPLRAYEALSDEFLAADSAMTIGVARRSAIAVQIAADSLAAAYRSSGRASDAERITAVIESTSGAARTALRLGFGSMLLRHGLENLIYDTNIPTPYRWQALAQLSRHRRCGSFAGIVFGSSERHRRFETAARRALVRSEADQARFQAILSEGGASIERQRTRCTLDWVRPVLRGGR